MTVFIFLGSLLAAMAIGVPIAYALLVSGAALMWHLDLFDAQILAQNVVNGADSFPLLAVPFFMLAGEIMNAGGLSKRIVHLALTLVGHKRGVLGFVVILAACMLAALSGSAVADTAALAALLLPMMVKAGHDKARAGGLIASAGIIAPVIPPSIGFVVFGVAANVSISKLFLAGIVPGLLMGVAIAITWYWVSQRENVTPPPKASTAEKLQALIGKLLEVARDRQGGTVERLLGNHVVEALLTREELHLEHVLEGFEELTDRDGFRAGIGGGIVHGVRV